MSRSNKQDVQLNVADTPWKQETQRNYVGRDKTTVKLQRQSYLDTDWMWHESPAAYDSLGDNHYSRWDMDHDENQTNKEK